MGPSDYALLELIDRLGGVQGRKRLQKLAYVAKVVGLPLEDEFCFHYYGTYSSGLAARVDQLVEAGLLRESERSFANGVEYGYDLTDKARAFLEEVRPTAPTPFRERMNAGLDRAAALKDQSVFVLELATSLLYWVAKGHSPAEAEAITHQRKKADPEHGAFQEARHIAEAVWGTRPRQARG
jgi:uncharacterized protein YwgA